MKAGGRANITFQINNTWTVIFDEAADWGIYVQRILSANIPAYRVFACPLASLWIARSVQFQISTHNSSWTSPGVGSMLSSGMRTDVRIPAYKEGPSVVSQSPEGYPSEMPYGPTMPITDKSPPGQRLFLLLRRGMCKKRQLKQALCRTQRKALPMAQRISYTLSSARLCRKFRMSPFTFLESLEHPESPSA